MRVTSVSRTSTGHCTRTCCNACCACCTVKTVTPHQSCHCAVQGAGTTISSCKQRHGSVSEVMVGNAPASFARTRCAASVTAADKKMSCPIGSPSRKARRWLHDSCDPAHKISPHAKSSPLRHARLLTIFPQLIASLDNRLSVHVLSASGITLM